MNPIKLLAVSVSGKFDKKILAPLGKDKLELKESSLEHASSLAKHFNPDLVLLYIDRSGFKRGLQFLKKLKDEYSDLPIICASPISSVEEIVALMKSGASDYLKMPLDDKLLKSSVESSVKAYQAVRRNPNLGASPDLASQFQGMVGVSTQMQEIFHMIKTVGKSNATVLILGESGTGKELVAKAVHNSSSRSKQKFIDINCGAIPKELLENELFGHEKGSFTGADRQYLGSCERANGGTLFLDEISEMDPSLQVKLLRVLQERSFTRIGGTQRIDVDIRIVAATNRKIEDEVKAGRFREDLYYRLNVVPIAIPPLRARREDVPYLARHFLAIYRDKNNKRFKEFAPDAIEALVNYDWQGNVRELENTIERAVVLHDDTQVKRVHLPKFVQNTQLPGRSSASGSVDPFQGIVSLELVERYAIEAAITHCGGDVSIAAKKLEIGQATLYRKLKKYGIRS